MSVRKLRWNAERPERWTFGEAEWGGDCSVCESAVGPRARLKAMEDVKMR
jgi:hypothetical protein